MISNVLLFGLRTVLATSIVQVARLFKVNLIWGSKSALFSGINIMGPLVGAYGGIPLSIAVFVNQALIYGFLSNFSLLKPLLYHIPTLFASAYWASTSYSIRLVVPIMCMILFIMHPVGAQAWVYSLYWLIPVILYWLPARNIFVQALGSTFTAHAVGSILWIYLIPMTPEMFIALIPVVIVERLLFASGMVIVYSIGDHVTKYSDFLNATISKYLMLRKLQPQKQ